MARRNDPLPVTGTETVIGTGVKVKGAFNCEGDISIDGWLDGEIKASGNVTIGVNGVIKGDISAQNITILGQLRGNIEAEGETTIGHAGNLRGNITTASLSIESGAMFIGRTTMLKPTAGVLEQAEASEAEQAEG